MRPPMAMDVLKTEGSLSVSCHPLNQGESEGGPLRSLTSLDTILSLFIRGQQTLSRHQHLNRIERLWLIFLQFFLR